MADILLIDDDEGFRTMLCRLLTRSGHTVTACEDGRKGVDLFRRNPGFLVITDLIMPEQEGIETIIQLRKEFPDVRIIAMSGGGRVTPEIYLESAANLGASRIFTKPLDTEEFMLAIRELTTLPERDNTIPDKRFTKTQKKRISSSSPSLNSLRR